jgi:hypothetical protein
VKGSPSRGEALLRTMIPDIVADMICKEEGKGVDRGRKHVIVLYMSTSSSNRGCITNS